MGERLQFPTPPTPPPDRGRLLTPAEVAAMIGGVSEAWVRRTVPWKISLGHSTVRWYDKDVQRWLDESRNAGLNTKR